MTTKFVKRRGTINIVEAKAEESMVNLLHQVLWLYWKLIFCENLLATVGKSFLGTLVYHIERKSTQFSKCLMLSCLCLKNYWLPIVVRIAVRIIRAARELEYQTVAIYSEADGDSHTSADEAICIGPAKSNGFLFEYESLFYQLLCD